MTVSPEFRRNLKTLAMILWVAFLAYGPIALFVVRRFRWPLLAINADFLAYIGTPAMAGGLCALVATPFYLMWAPRKLLLPLFVFILDFSLVFSRLGNILEAKGFADFIKPESAYVQKHCAPINFVQDGKTYRFGMCDLVIDGTGQMDASFVYDTSHDVGNYDNLSKTDKVVFVRAVRKYFNDDPNEQFENAYFTATQYYQNFFQIMFDDANAEGFVRDFGTPPENRKNPYPPMFW